MGEVKKNLKRFWDFLKKDSWLSLIVCLLLAFIVIKFIFFPVLSLLTGSVLPLVIVESCSMYHSNGLENVLANDIYQDYNLSLEDAKNWPFKNGLSKGDVIFVVSPKNLEIGDVIIFEGGEKHPVIHRIISLDKTITTKGDHNLGFLEVEKDIGEEQVIGKALFRIPLIGWVKLIFFEASRTPSERGLCV